MANGSKKLVYIAGSMRNREGILLAAKAVEAAGFDVFHSWINPGPETDDQWMQWQKALGRDYWDAMQDPHVANVYEFDLEWLNKSDALVMVGPAGKSAHGELGYMFGKGKPTIAYIASEPERWDIMTAAFANVLVHELHEVVDALHMFLAPPPVPVCKHGTRKTLTCFDCERERLIVGKWEGQKVVPLTAGDRARADQFEKERRWERAAS